MIPEYNKKGNLPPGVYKATWQEICKVFGTNGRRKELLVGLKAALDQLKQSGCLLVYLDGSFVTSKIYPNDYDLCWQVDGVNPDKLDNILLDVEWTREKIKQKYLGDVLPNRPRLPRGNLVILFQRDREGNKKGIIAIDLRTFE